MKVSPSENRTIVCGSGVSAIINLTTRQRWEQVENKIPGNVSLVRNDVKLILKEEDFKKYFKV